MAKPSHAKPSHAKCQVVQKHTSVTRAQAHTVPGEACGLPCIVCPRTVRLRCVWGAFEMRLTCVWGAFEMCLRCV